MHHAGILGDGERRGFRAADFEYQQAFEHRYTIVKAQLLDETALFTGLQAVAAGIIKQRHLGGTGQEAVEVICPDAILVFVGGETESPAEIIGNERVGDAFQRENALVHGEDDDSLEIQGTRFEYAHDLQTRQRLATEGDGDSLGYAAQETEVGIEFHRDASLPQDVLHAVHGGKIVEDELLLDIHGALRAFVVVAGVIAEGGKASVQLREDFDEIIREVAERRDGLEKQREERRARQIGFRDINPVVGADFPHKAGDDFRFGHRHIAVVEDGKDVAEVKHRLAVDETDVALEREDIIHQRSDGGAGQRVSHRYVDMFDFLRDGIQDRDQEVFVRQDDSRTERQVSVEQLLLAQIF